MIYLTKEIKPNNKTIDGSQEVLGTGEWQILEIFNMTVVATTHISQNIADKIITSLNNEDNNKLKQKTINKLKQKTIVYLIVGETGEYDDYRKWIVRAYLNKTLCSNYINELNECLINNNVPLSCDEIATTKPSLFIDSKLEKIWMNYGVQYRIEEIEIFN